MKEKARIILSDEEMKKTEIKLVSQLLYEQMLLYADRNVSRETSTLVFLADAVFQRAQAI